MGGRYKKGVAALKKSKNFLKKVVDIFCPMRYTNVRVTENNTKRYNKTTEYAPLAQLVEQ